MYRNRKGHIYRKIIRKAFALIVLLIGIRLVWVSVSGWTARVPRKEHDSLIEARQAVKFVGGEHDGALDKEFEFSMVNGRDLEDTADKNKMADVRELNSKAIRKGKTHHGSRSKMFKPDEKKQEKNHGSAASVISKDTTVTLEKAKQKDVTPVTTLNKVEGAKRPNDKITTPPLRKPPQGEPGIHLLDIKVEAVSINHTKVKENDNTTTGRKHTPPHLEKNNMKERFKSTGNGQKEVILKYDSKDNKSQKSVHKKEKHNYVSAQNKSLSRDADLDVEELQKNPDFKRGNCKFVPKWGQKYNADISTYDLFKNVSYQMESDGRYPIPVRTFEEIKKSENLKHLTVVLVPFSHADPGYGLTIEQYYDQMTRDTLNNMVIKLLQYQNMTFQWAETVFLARWFEDLDDAGKDNVKKLIKKGQLEIVLGGWVMPDEASTNYIAVVDQLIEGHQWLLENLAVKPTSAWVNDPFGYSSTMPYLWKLTGMDNLLFLRINQPVKAKLMKRKSLDFMWRPYWKTSNESDVLSSLMPYTNYWVSDVCGPEQVNCQEFNFLHLGEGNSKAVQVTDVNVAEQARKLSDQFRITGDLYKYNTLYIGLGEDFSYPRPHQWDNMYNNYEKLISYINSQNSWNMTVKFGTLTEYFTRIRDEDRKMAEHSEKTRNTALTFPTLSGDFFPYTERNQEFWTGYFTTRPLNKRFSREIESLVRAADIFNVVVYSLFKYYGVEFTASDAVTQGLRIARRELGMFMHHDGITGMILYFSIDIIALLCVTLLS